MTSAQLLTYAEAVAEAVQALGSVPSGHLYASMMGAMSI